MSDFATGKNPTDPIKSSENVIFIWVDILGFSNNIEGADNYTKLAEVLKAFRDKFKNEDSFETHPISDGILLVIKNENYSYEEIVDIFNDIGKRQRDFIKAHGHFVRGGIAVGTLSDYPKEKNSQLQALISNGMARSYKIENRCTCWPIIGTTEEYMKKLRKIPMIPKKKSFEFCKTFNKNGRKIFFINFLKEEEKDSKEILEMIKKEIKNQKSEKVRAKYIWLLKYYKKIHNNELPKNLKDMVL